MTIATPKNNNERFIKFIRTNDIEGINISIKFKKIKLNYKNNRFIIDVAVFGRSEIISLLLKYEEVDPSDELNYAISLAHSQNHTKIISLLLNDKRVKNTLKKDNVDLYNQLTKLDIKEKVENF
jgi:hypothetical protein